MKFQSLLQQPLLYLLALSPLSACAQSDLLPAQTVSLHIWPLSAPTSTPYLTVTYRPTRDRPAKGSEVQLSTQQAAAAAVQSIASGDDDEFVRLGFYRADLAGTAAAAEDKGWVGIAVPPSALGADRDKLVVLHLDGGGAAWHVGLESVPVPAPPKPSKATARGSGGAAKQEVVPPAEGKVEVRLLGRAQGPKPVLNKPVVLNREGKVEGSEQTQTFFQKYWWAIALFLLLQAFIGGGGGGDGK